MVKKVILTWKAYFCKSYFPEVNWDWGWPYTVPGRIFNHSKPVVRLGVPFTWNCAMGNEKIKRQAVQIKEAVPWTVQNSTWLNW